MVVIYADGVSPSLLYFSCLLLRIILEELIKMVYHPYPVAVTKCFKCPFLVPKFINL